MRIVFMGTPDFAVGSLCALVEGGYNVVAVVTVPDKPAGRGLKMQQSAVKEYADRVGIRVMQPEKLKDPVFVEEFGSLDADLAVVIAFRMLPEVIWSQPRLGTFNLHASLLPQYRGAAPINRAIIDGRKTTGVTTFFLNGGIDKGDIIDSREVPIAYDDNAGTLHDKLMATGSKLVIDTLNRIAEGKVILVPQPQSDDEIRLAPKIFKDDCRIDWGRTADNLYDFIRGLSPYPAAWTVMRKVVHDGGDDGREEVQVKIFSAAVEKCGHQNSCGTVVSDGRSFLKIACRDGYLVVSDLQAAGKKRLSVAEFLRGFKDAGDYVCL